MKIGKFALVSCALATSAIVSTNTFANIQLFSKNATGDVINTINVIPQKGQEYASADSFKFSVGYSKTNPCSDLATLEIIYGSPNDPLQLDAGANQIHVDSLRKAVGPGTCFKMDFTYQNKVYSTGNIKIILDSNDKVIGTDPSSETLDFSN